MVEAASHQHGAAAARLEGLHQHPRAFGGADAFVETAGDRALVQPRQQRHPFAQRASEIEFALHRPLGDFGDLRLDPGVVGQFVDAFLPDHGRIHVRNEDIGNAEWHRAR